MNMERGNEFPKQLDNVYVVCLCNRSTAGYGSFNTHSRVWVLLMVEDPTVTVKCRTVINALFLYLNLCLSVMLNSISYPYLFLVIHSVIHVSSGSRFSKTLRFIQNLLDLEKYSIFHRTLQTLYFDHICCILYENIFLCVLPLIKQKCQGSLSLLTSYKLVISYIADNGYSYNLPT